MTGGLIQLVACGVEDIFLTKDPQITFFKVVYRRHTNFATEAIPLAFSQPLDFGKKASCIISKQGDLISKMYLVITLPAINLNHNLSNLNNQYTKFAWVRKIGFSIIKKIEIIIGGELIDRQYGDWLNIWNELLGPKNNGFNKMIGNIPELTDFTSQKDEYILYIPLQFWFCRNSGSALPLISLQYSEVKINVELNDVDNCLLITPTHYIDLLNDFVNFKPFEYIEQSIDGSIASGIFTHFDFINKRLYYMKTSYNNFQSAKKNIQANPYSDVRSLKYFIKGLSSNTFAVPALGTNPKLCSSNKNNIPSIVKCFLLIDYIFLDKNERLKFLQTKHDYLIEQIITTDKQNIESSNTVIKIPIRQPCKFLVWTVQSRFFYANKDQFNYSDDYKYTDNIPYGKSLVSKQTLLINGQERSSFREFGYFNYVQPYQYFPYGPNEGINVYSFSLFPNQFQPSGSCNFSLIDDIQIKLLLNGIISHINPAIFTAYAVTYNILRIINGLSGIVFV